MTTRPLFGATFQAGERASLGPGAVVLRGFVRGDEEALLEEVRAIEVRAPFRHLTTPGGQVMSVAMTNCGPLGWVSDRAGYRYAAVDPSSGLPWPPMPLRFLELAARAAQAANFRPFLPDACLVNRYVPGARLSLHRDMDERDLEAPIVSVSLGLPATFLFGGLRREDPPRRVALEGGDVAVWGGPSRLAFHGVAKLDDAEDLRTGRCRINLTFRKVH